jgi:L-threonylcarbamoyladenylate synthase
MIYENDIQESVKTFAQHGVILYPTDTIWGLGCLADDEIAIEKIYNIKQRPAEKSFILLMTDAKQLSKYIANPLPDLQTVIESFKEPTTIIYDNAINLPSSLIATDGSIAVRITNDPFCRSLIKRTKKPIVSTSANLSGAVSPSIYASVASEIKNQVDYIVLHRQDDETISTPSSILKLTPSGNFLKIR